MLISELLDHHRSVSAEMAHADVLGDPFLMRENFVYRKVKEWALEIGCQYQEAWPQYLVLPFHELSKIVQTKTIPYVPSARMLIDVESRRPNIFTTDEFFPPESHHLHEAAHVIAEHVFAKVRLNTPEEKILKAIFCESFANTVDVLAYLPATTEIHRYLLSHNSYMKPLDEELDLIRRLAEQLGFRGLAVLTLFSYLSSNFLIETFVSPTISKILNRYVSDVVVTPQLLADCEALGVMCERLDPLFRVQTTELYLKGEGFDGNVYELLSFPFMKVFEENESFGLAVEALANHFSQEGP